MNGHFSFDGCICFPSLLTVYTGDGFCIPCVLFRYMCQWIRIRPCGVLETQSLMQISKALELLEKALNQGIPQNSISQSEEIVHVMNSQQPDTKH